MSGIGQFKISLHDGSCAVVDAQWYEILRKYKWYNRKGYAVRVESARIDGRRVQKSYAMHRVIMIASKGLDVDHVNRDKLDNRTSNLRICTRSQNSMNSVKKRGTSRYKGIYWYRSRGKWVAEIVLNYKKKNLGYFASEDEAAQAYNCAAVKYFGEFALLNAIQTQPSVRPSGKRGVSHGD